MENETKCKIGPANFLVMLIFMMFTSGICFLIFRKFRYKFDPVHVFLVNYFGTLSVIMLAWGLSAFLQVFSMSEDFCLE